MAVDMHSHYYGGLVDGLLARRDRPRVSRDGPDRVTLHAMTADTVMHAGYTDIGARLRYLDDTGLRTQMMTFPGALGVDAMPHGEVGALIRSYNDHLSDVCRESAGRFIGLGGLPLDDLDASVAEIRRIRRETGLLGAILPGNLFLGTDRAERLRPVFKAANETGALFMIHPGIGPGDAVPAPYADNSVLRLSGLDLQASVAHMAVTLMFGTLLEDFPDVEVQLVNLGGTLPFILERLDAIAASRGIAGPTPSTRIRRLHYDSASLGPRALELAVKVIGADRIMLGTDYPIFRPDPLRETLAAAHIPEADKSMVRSETARVLLRKLG